MGRQLKGASSGSSKCVVVNAGKLTDHNFPYIYKTLIKIPSHTQSIT